MEPLMRSTLGESLVAVLMAGVAAFFAAILGFVGAAWFCSALLSGEMGEWGLVVAPPTALIAAIVAFVAVFHKIRSYGDPPHDPPA
jgi:hypothetical protein